jgi:hypothetical protein
MSVLLPLCIDMRVHVAQPVVMRCAVLCFPSPQELADVKEADERAAAEKRVKSRTLGTVRLIAELYRKDVVSEAIITVCIRELLEVG